MYSGKVIGLHFIQQLRILCKYQVDLKAPKMLQKMVVWHRSWRSRGLENPLPEDDFDLASPCFACDGRI